MVILSLLFFIVLPYMTVAPNHIISFSCSWTLNTLNPTMCFIGTSSFCWILWFLGSSVLPLCGNSLFFSLLYNIPSQTIYHHAFIHSTVWWTFEGFWILLQTVLPWVVGPVSPTTMCKEGSLYISLEAEVLGQGFCTCPAVQGAACVIILPAAVGKSPLLHRFTSTRYFPLLSFS